MRQSKHTLYAEYVDIFPQMLLFQQVGLLACVTGILKEYKYFLSKELAGLELAPTAVDIICILMNQFQWIY